MPLRPPRHTDLVIVGAVLVVSLVIDLEGDLGVIAALWRASWIALVALAGREADRRSLIVLAVVALVVGQDLGLLAATSCAAGAVVLALAQPRPDASWRHPLGAATGGLGALALCHQSSLLSPWGQVLASVAATTAVLCTAYGHLRGSRRQKVHRVALVAVGSVGLVLVVGGLATLQARSTLGSAAASTELALDLARSGEIDDAVTTFESAERSFARSHDQLTDIWTLPARAIPVVGDNLSAGADASAIGRDLAASAVVLGVDGDYQSLRFVDGTLDLESVEAMTPAVQQARADIDQAAADLAAIDRTWLLGPTTDQLDALTEELAGARRDVIDAAELLTALPVMLGADRPTHWYVMFTQPAEARYAGGFVAEYSLLRAEGGTITRIESGNSWDLNDVPGDRTLDMPDWYISRYRRYHPDRYFQNHTASPDLPTNAEVVAQLAPQVGLPPIDGVISIDPAGLAALIEVTDPIIVPGIAEPLTAENAERYLYIDQYTNATERVRRDDLLHRAGDAAFDALLSGETPGPGAVARILGPAVAGGHLALTSLDPVTNAALDTVGISGRFSPPDTGDWVSVRWASSEPSKLDTYLERDLRYDVDVDAGGRLTATATVTLRNAAPEGLPDYVTQSITGLPPASIALQVSLYSPQVVESVTIDGEPAKAGELREPWANTFTLPVVIPRGEQRVLVFELDGVLRGDDARVTVIPQPAYRPMTATVTMRGPFDTVRGSSDALDEPITFGS